MRFEVSRGRRLARRSYRSALTAVVALFIGGGLAVPAAGAATLIAGAPTAHAAASATCPSGSVNLSSGTYGGGNDSGDNVCVPSGAGVTLAGSEDWNTLTVIGSLVVGDANSCGTPSYGLTLAKGGTVDSGGALSLWASASCAEGGPTSLIISSGTLDNAGTLASVLVGSCGTPPSPCDYGGQRYLSGNITNTGVLRVDWPLTVDGAGTLNNEGSIDVASGQSLETTVSGVTLSNQASASLTNEGTVSLIGGDTFTEAGTITGTAPMLTGDTLLYTGTGASAIEVLGSTTLSGNIASGQTLELFAASGFCQAPNAAVTAAHGFTNAGTIIGVCGSSVSLAVTSGTIVNTGTIGSGSPVAMDVQTTVNNEGLLESGYGQDLTVEALANYSSSTKTLSKGRYLCSDNGEIVVPGMDITTLDATVTLNEGCELSDGSNDSLTSLTHNEGDLTLDGNSINFSGSLSNSGTLYVGRYPTLRVAGNFTQTSTGTLATELASSTIYGQLLVSGKSSLAGTLDIARDNTYTPAKGDTLQLITFASKSGRFTSVKNTGAGSGLYFVLRYTSGAAELVVSKTTLSASPSSGKPGSKTDLTGAGFSPGEMVAISFKDKSGKVNALTSAVANGSGSFSISETVPAAAESGAGSFQAIGQTSEVTLKRSFTVT